MKQRCGPVLKIALIKKQKLDGAPLLFCAVLVGALTMAFMYATRAVFGSVVHQGLNAAIWGGICSGAAALLATFLVRVRFRR